MAAPVRFATIGSNFITDRFLDAGAQTDGFELAAIYSRTSERAAEFASKRKFSGPTFTDLAALAAAADVDAVYIASPTSEHAKQAIMMLKNGKHVLCEKPFCSNSAELEAVLQSLKALRASDAQFVSEALPVVRERVNAASAGAAGEWTVEEFKLRQVSKQ